MCSFSLSLPEASKEQTMQTNLTTWTENICLPIKLSQKVVTVLLSKSSSSCELMFLSMMIPLLLLLMLLTLISKFFEFSELLFMLLLLLMLL
jgi:uncharacterized membrane protein YjdF